MKGAEKIGMVRRFVVLSLDVIIMILDWATRFE